MKRVLIVEDDPDQSALLAQFLTTREYEVEQTHTAADALQVQLAPAFVLLDLNLPDGQGIALCPLLKKRFPEALILMLTARKDEVDRILGLEIGADDYLTKPYALREVEARMRAVLRRRTPDTGSSRTQLAKIEPLSGQGLEPLLLDADRCLARIGRVHTSFTAQEFRLLSWLTAHPGRIWSRDQLIQACWLDSAACNDRIVDAMIARIRKKLSAAFGRPFIFTKHGLGYGFSDAE